MRLSLYLNLQSGKNVLKFGCAKQNFDYIISSTKQQFFFFFHVSIGKQCKIILYVLLQFLHSPLLIWMRGVAITQTCTVFLHTVSSQHPYRLHRYTCVSMWIDFIFYLKYQTSIIDCEVFGVCCCGVCFIMKMLS